MRVRVYLATTEGPVQVERLTRERAQQSVVCLKRTTKVLAISGDYDAFIKQPSGVIEREFGPFEAGAFRLDVSGPIGDGDSWQLGVFAAHALGASGMLAGPDDEIGAAIWLTGRVDNDLRVGDVAHLPEKLHASRDELERLLSRDLPVTLFLPSGSQRLAAVSELPARIKVVEVARTADLRQALDLGGAGDRPLRVSKDEKPPGTISTPPPTARGSKKRRYGAVLLAVLIGALLLIAALAVPDLVDWRRLAERGDFQGLDRALSQARSGQDLLDRLIAMAFERWLVETRPAADDISVMLYERRPPEGNTCAAVHFQRVEAATLPVAMDSPATFAPSSHDGLCGLAFAVVARGRSVYAAASLDVTSGKYFEAVARPKSLTGMESFSGRQGWAIDLPWRLREPFAYRLDIVAAGYPVDKALRWLQAQGDRQAAIEHMARRGITVLSARHRVNP